MELDPSICIHAQHVSKHFKNSGTDISILRDVSLIIKYGESIAIKGRSGSGKTTLLTLLAGLDVPSQGKIILQNYQLHELNEEQRAELRGQYMGFIFQTFQLQDSLTALENVMLPLEIQYVPHKKAKIIAQEWLEKVRLDHRMYHLPAKLSGGEQQRVSIARAFVTQPKIIFADEMTGSLDAETGEEIANIIFTLNASEKTTLVLVTHDDNLAERCQKAYRLDRGILYPC